MTKQREEILKIIRLTDKHLTAEEVFSLAQQALPKIVRATVYNNLNALVELGAIKKVKIYGEADRFDRNVLPHDHLICNVCGSVIDIEQNDIVADIEEKYGVKIGDYQLNISYTCNLCRDEFG